MCARSWNIARTVSRARRAEARALEQSCPVDARSSRSRAGGLGTMIAPLDKSSRPPLGSRHPEKTASRARRRTTRTRGTARLHRVWKGGCTRGVAVASLHEVIAVEQPTPALSKLSRRTELIQFADACPLGRRPRFR